MKVTIYLPDALAAEVKAGLTDTNISAVCQVALVYGFEGPAALNGSQFIDEAALFPTRSRIEFDGAVHAGSHSTVKTTTAPRATAVPEAGSVLTTRPRATRPSSAPRAASQATAAA